MPSRFRHIRSAAFLLFAFAAGARIAFIAALIGFHHGEANVSSFQGLNGDERDYIARAEHLRAGAGLTAGGAQDRMWRTPAYPAFLAALFACGGRSLALARAAQALLGAIACVLLLRIGQRLFDRRTGLLAGLWFALYPPHLYMAGQLLSENLLLPALLGAIALFLRLAETRAQRDALGCGLLAGLAALAKPEAIGLLPALLLLPCLVWPRGLRLGACLLLAASLLLAPWLLRNHRLSGAWTLSSVGGEAFWGGNNEFVLALPLYHGYWMAPSDMPPEQRERIRTAGGELAQDRMRWRLGIEFLRTHRADLPRLAAYKLRRFYSVWVREPRERWALVLGFGWLLPFIAWGALTNGRRFARERSPGLAIFALLLYYHLLAIVFWGANRLRLPIDPFLILFGVERLASLHSVGDAAVEKRNRRK